MAGIYIEEGRLDEAYAALNTQFLATTDKDISSHYYIWAMYFEKRGQLDSAVAYNKRGMNYSDVSIKRDVSLDLARLLMKQGKHNEAIKYYEQYSVYSDSVTASELNETSDMLSQVEKNIDIERKNTILAETKTNLTILLSVIIFTVIVVSLILIKHYSNVRKRIREQQERANNYLSQLQETGMQKMKRNEERIAQLETELSVSNEKLTEIRKSLMRNEAEMLAKQNEHMLFKEKHRELLIADLADTDVYKLYHTPNAVPSSADYHRLVEALNKAYNNFTKRLKEFYPDINDNEVWICCMVKAGLSSKEICNISPYSYSSLGMAKSRLYFKMFQKREEQKILTIS